MKLDEFLSIDRLEQLAKEGGPRANFLLKMADRIDSRELNRLFEGQTQLDIEAQDQQERLVTELRGAINGIRRGDVNGIEELKLRQLKRWKKDFSGKGNRQLRSVVSIGQSTGVINDPNDIHIHDLCSGSGILSTGIAFLRGDKNTSSTCVEINPDPAKIHELLRISVGRKNDSLKFTQADLMKTGIEIQRDKINYCLAKHACGPATDMILEHVLKLNENQTPYMTAIMSCCHSKAKNHKPRSAEGFTNEEWDILTRTAEWTRKEREEETQFLGRLAMRMVDCIRIGDIPDRFEASVKECVSPETTQKNHLIKLRNLN